MILGKKKRKQNCDKSENFICTMWIITNLIMESSEKGEHFYFINQIFCVLRSPYFYKKILGAVLNQTVQLL